MLLSTFKKIQKSNFLVSLPAEQTTIKHSKIMFFIMKLQRSSLRDVKPVL
jgi:hypothetical protein